MALFDYIQVFYNQRRRHSTLGQISPAEFERRRVTLAAWLPRLRNWIRPSGEIAQACAGRSRELYSLYEEAAG